MIGNVRLKYLCIIGFISIITISVTFLILPRLFNNNMPKDRIIYTNQEAVNSDCCCDETPASEENITVEDEKLIVFKGCSIIRRAFMTAAANAYQKKTGIEVKVIGGGATLGIRATAANDSDIGGSCRPPLPDRFEQEKGVKMVHVGWDSLVYITHPSNPVNNISLKDVKKILIGEITNWKQLGGEDKKIVLIFRSQVPEHGGKVSGVGYTTRKMIFNDPEKNYTDKALFFKHSSEIEEYIEKLENSFAVTGYSSANKRKVKILNLNGYQPTKENIVSAKYPLFRPLYIIIREKPSPKVQEFIDWLLSDEGQKVVSDEGTVNLKEGKTLVDKFKFWQYTDLIINYKQEQKIEN
ncbi:MAG: phosphate ABC transporter substrate-binding protein [Cyanobacteriota bacterium]